jgi:hypothetical protein
LKSREGILVPVLVIAAIIYAIVDDSPVPPSADAQEPVALACLKRAGFMVKSDTYSGGSLPSNGSDVKYKLDVDDEAGSRVAIIYLADLRQGIDLFADTLKENQKTYGDYKGETIELRGTAVIRLAPGFNRAGAIHVCVDRAAKAKET